MILESEKTKAAFQIVSKLKSHNLIAYFAGGSVRDHLMGKTPEDFDIATSATPDQVESLFDHTIPVGKQFGVILVVMDHMTFEVATFRCEGGYVDGRHPSQVSFSVPEEDAKRRDFTVNALFYDPFAQKVIDYVNGAEDIKRKIIRAVGDPETRFDEDKLRLLRAIRFASTLGFEIEAPTWNAIKKKASTITQVSPERIRDELVKIFTRPGAGRGFELLSESGLMRVILPEIEIMRGVEQPPEHHPEGDVFIHTRLLLEKLNQPSLTVALGALFHDVGKPPTFQIRNGKITFYNHAQQGARMTEAIMKRLRFSNQEIRGVTECVEHHMKFADVQKMRPARLKTFMARPTFRDELEVHRVDCESSHGKLDNYHFLAKQLETFTQEELKPKPWVNGHDLIKLGLSEGPEIKDVLDVLYDKQLEGGIQSREEALEQAAREITRRRPNY